MHPLKIQIEIIIAIDTLKTVHVLQNIQYAVKVFRIPHSINHPFPPIVPSPKPNIQIW